MEDYFEWLRILKEAKAAGITTTEIRKWLEEIIKSKEKAPQSHAGLEALMISRIEAKYK